MDRTLRLLRDSDLLFGGVVMILAGDFRQTLPVIARVTPADQLNACIKQSYLWPCVQLLRLSTNMRVHLKGEIEAALFLQRLLSIRDGSYPSDPITNKITFTSDICRSVSSKAELIDKVFPYLSINFRQELAERAYPSSTHK